MPLKVSVSASIFVFALVNPMIERAVMLFPDPLSPTMPRISPSFIEKFSSLTATCVPVGSEKLMLKSLTSSRFISLPLCRECRLPAS